MTDGFLLVDKAGSWTSHDVVAKARRILGQKKIGRGTVISATRIAVTPAEKAGLHSRLDTDGAAVVDLESAAFAGEAVERGLPCLVARAVCDTAEEALPLDFNRFRTAAGGVSQGRVLRHALTHPGIVEALMGLRDRVRSCSQVLAELVTEVIGR